MPSKPGKKLKKLAGLYISNKASAEERKAIEAYYDLFADAPAASEKVDMSEEEKIGEDMKQWIHARMYHTKKQVPFYLRNWFSAAAAILIVCSLALILWIQKGATDNRQRAAVIRNEKQYRPESYTRVVNLPDGSSVVLRQGSRLTILSSFLNKTREVKLTGEAYFNVVRDEHHPFLVHTGKIVTRVLGTSFNIKALPNDRTVTVAVSTGKVRVENDGKSLAVLSKGNQVTALLNGISVTPKPADMQKVLSWARADMNFDGVRFSELAEHISRRYGVEVRFIKPEIANCRITGGFRGTESLDELLGILSLTMNTTYRIEGETVEIDGQSCK